eukprot:TRINITY_DN2191_c0_g1_i2.p2 TRINITY_DN2191_c0_g1~~TRINITY_DN2191_c0_g1_i2.p2  ORF type:complete len:222 (+),score=17.92 TRINITY_DN2191_c0_g1_i2:449-1114(+)
MMCPTRTEMQPADCTATVIGPKTIITAAHCLNNIRICPDDPARCAIPCEDFVFSPGYPNHNNTYEIQATTAPGGFLSGILEGQSISQFGEFDIAVLTVKTDLPTGMPEAQNIMSYGFFECNNDTDVEIFIAGYPSDLDGGQNMYMSKCNVNYNNCGDSTTFLYECDTAAGMSGSTIWAKSGDSIVIKGIHSRYDSEENLNAGVMFNRNSAFFVSSAVLSLP